MSKPINFLKIKTDMVFEFRSGQKIMFNTMLLNDENPHWSNWLSEQKVHDLKYECPDNWDVNALVYVLECYANFKDVIPSNKQKVLTINNYEKIYAIAHALNDMQIKRKIYSFIKINWSFSEKIYLSTFDNKDIIEYVKIANCDFLVQLFHTVDIVRISKNCNTLAFLNEDRRFTTLNNIMVGSHRVDAIRNLFKFIKEYDINETELAELLLYIEPALITDYCTTVTNELFKKIMKWKN